MEIFVSILAVMIAFTCLGLIIKSDLKDLLGRKKTVLVVDKKREDQSN